MKKIITVLFAVLAMSSMFAYIPNKKNVEKIDNKYFCYHTYKYKWDKRKTKTTTYLVYENGEVYIRDPMTVLYCSYKEKIQEKIETDRQLFLLIAHFINKKYYNKKEEKELRLRAKQIKRNSINGDPFLTEENWQTITKEEWIEQLENFFKDFKD